MNVLERSNPSLLFFCGVVLCASGYLSEPAALIAGLLFGFFLTHPLPDLSRTLSRFLLQAAVVLLGFGMNLREVARVGKDGFLFTAIGITLALFLGWMIGKFLRVPSRASFLITCGTAICGGSAIAALAPVLHANEEDMAVSLGTVFSLNALALLLFPAIGWKLHLSQTQFGLWAALAIHDTSSVVGAASRFGPQALLIGTTVKLARALWILPVAMLTAVAVRRSGTDATGPARVQIPWFIALFLLAALVRASLPSLGSLYTALVQLGKNSLTVVLFLIGTGLSRRTLARVGLRPMMQGLLLWALVGTASLLAIRSGWIHL